MVNKCIFIGRVGKELMFQVTQRNAHIDPMQMIR